MEFSSVEFLAFLTISFLFFSIIKPKFKWIVLLAASFIFIYSFSIKLLIFTLGFSVVNYFIGIAISKSTDIKIKNLWYHIGMWSNIGILVFYKYTSFLLDNILALFGQSAENIDSPLLNLAIPLGISFYTFQSIGYFIDLKRGTKPAETNIGKFMLFLIYFPKFISGPIERTGSLIPQINKPQVWDEGLVKAGVLQLLWGFFKTMVISDRLATLVNAVNGDLYDKVGLILVVNFFMQFLYLYFNFSGYTDIVLGVSKLFGIKLLDNFSRPLFATNVSEYWKRWHMSLTQWCNDYIFKRIILKRMKWKLWASVYGTFLTFLIIGIWHGASWNFVILGLLQGIAINYEFFTKRTRLNIGKKLSKGINLTLSRLFTFIFICFSHVFFFTANLQDAMYYFANMFKSSDKNQLLHIGLSPKDFIIIGLGILIVYISEYRDETGRVSIRSKILNNNILFWVVVVISVAIILNIGIMKGAGFIYEQF